MDLKKLSLKKSQLYKDIETLPLINWILLNSKEDLRYLIKGSVNDLPTVRKKTQQKIIAKFKDIQFSIYDIIGVDLILQNSWGRYLYDYLHHYRNFINNEIRLLEGLEPIKIKNYSNTKFFYEYLENLDKYYTNYEVYEYSFISDFENRYCKFYGLDKLPNNVKLATKEMQAWYTLNRYNYEIKQLDSSLIFQQTMFSETFVKNFIQKKIIKVNSILDYSKRVEQGYYLENKINDWILARRKIFDINNLFFSPKTDSNINEEIANVEMQLGYNINTATVTVSEYYNKIKVLIANAKRQKEAQKKPNKGN